jgi:hypothetical protein
MSQQTATVCIFEDKEFSEKVMFPAEMGFDGSRVRCELGWQFNLHRNWGPEAEMNNSEGRRIRLPTDFNDALKYIQNLSGYACLIFDLNLVILDEGQQCDPLSKAQQELVYAISNEDVIASSYPGLFLALEASRNTGWRGVIAIASNVGRTLAYQEVVQSMQTRFPDKEFILLDYGITSAKVTSVLRRGMFDKCLETFLGMVGASKPAKDRLHHCGKAGGWFAYSDHSELPHRFDDWLHCQNSREVLRNYLMKVLRCRELDFDELMNSDLGGKFYDELKTVVGTCAMVYSDKGDKNLSLYALMICAGACCPQPLSWLKKVKHISNAEVFHPDVSPQEAQNVFRLIVGERGLFPKLFVWDTARAPRRHIREPVIKDAELTHHELKFILHEDFSVAKLADECNSCPRYQFWEVSRLPVCKTGVKNNCRK